MGRKRTTTEQFIKRAKERHGDKYDYSETVYVDMHTKVRIKCPEHNCFEILPYTHIKQGSGCPKCGLLKAAKSRSLSFDEFLKRAWKIHDKKYAYVEESYKGVGKKVTIVCKFHGRFEQRAADHLNGFGCKKCSRSKQT